MNKELTIRSSYMKEKKEALIVLLVAIPLLCYGAFSFEFGGAGSTVEAISVAVSLTFGLLGVIGGLLLLLFTKTSLGLVESKEPKPIIKKEKEMSKKDGITKEKPVEKSGSVGLMQREKELVKRADELTTLVNEVETELNQVRENLETKGWVNSDDGWVIE